MSDHLQFCSVSKSFPGVQALDNVSFSVTEGSVHALVGENGAGKSTLLKILSGAYAPTSGHIQLGGQQRLFQSTREAIDAGVSVIYQELNLVPEMTVAENLLLGNMPNRLGFVDKKKMLAQAFAQLAVLGERFSPQIKVKNLSIGQRQMLEIAKALLHNAKVIAFDEPTSSLSEKEAQKLFEVIRELKADKRVIVYVSHRMEEIFSLCDALTVFRDGKIVADYQNIAAVTRDQVVTNMVGRPIKDIYHYAPRPSGETVLEVLNLRGEGLSGETSFSVAAGEILGFFGLVGAGRSELLKLIYHANVPTGGEIRVRGEKARIANPADAIKHGIVLCPEDRKWEGIIPIRSVHENINLSIRRIYARFGFFVDDAREEENTARFIQKLSIKTPSPRQLVENLSGGNQQKVILARWLSEEIKVVLMDEPTRGIDVGTKSEMYRIIAELADRGIAMVITSSELPEVMGICDRIAVMREGKIVAMLRREDATAEKIMKLALPAADCEPTSKRQECVP